MEEIPAALAFGSNLGNREENISLAVNLLQCGGFNISAISDSITSEPVDCTMDSGIFLNGALTGRWSGSAFQLLELCQSIESKLGRKRVREINSPRPIDLDILLFGNEIIKSEQLMVPHPRMHLRDFVILPLAQVAADWYIPGIDRKVSELAEVFK